jgi:hypothetical protein
MPIRGTNPFIHTQALEDPHSWYYDDGFWREYIQQLARSRHNFLDFHACYDMMSTNFPNIYPYFFKFDDYADVGVSEKQARKNLAQFKKIVDMAEDHGIMVGLMAYTAYWMIPNEQGPPDSTDQVLADYTARCVKTLINEVPNLKFFGFRVGESGKEASFYQDSYLRGLKEAGREDVHLYTRSWVTTQNALENIADDYPGQMFLEIKYNGEQLGLPYQVTGGWMKGKGSYAYQSYSNFPRKMSVLWQIRANGTHRIFPWGDPEFIRRAVKACTLIDGAGYTVEPLTAYYPLKDYYSNRIYVNNDFCQWLTERDWFWYELWGRLGYDPDTPEEVWISMFQQRFGKQAGKAVYRMMTESSKLVPLMFTYRGAGPDHRSIAPELEWGGDLEDFATCKPLEVTAFQSPMEFAEMIAAGEFSGKITPLEVSRTLDKHSAAAMQALEQARKAGILEEGSQEFDYLARNTEALEALSSYYANKIRAAVDYSLCEKLGAPWYAEQLKEHTDAFVEDWQRLVLVTDRAFHPFIETLRQYGDTFHWRYEGRKLVRDIKFVNSYVGKVLKKKVEAPNVAGYILPALESEPGKAITIRANLYSDAPNAFWPLVKYRAMGQHQVQDALMHRVEGTTDLYRVDIPLKNLPGDSGILEYMIYNKSRNYRMTLPPGSNKNNPQKFYRVTYGEDRTPPEVELLPEQVDREAEKAVIRVKLSDPSGIHSAELLYKAMPSTEAWERIPLEEQDGVYQTEVPMDYEGLQYCMELIDGAGNGVVWPDIQKETPYVTVEGWDRPAYLMGEAPLVLEGLQVKSDFAINLGVTEVGRPVYMDRGYEIERAPQELTGLPRVLFKNDAAKNGSIDIQMQSGNPLRVYFVFGDPNDPGTGWAVPLEGWELYKSDAWEQEGKTFSIYYKDYPAGKSTFHLEGGTGAMAGIEMLE